MTQIIYVNEAKRRRAQEILNLISGVSSPKTIGQTEDKVRFSGVLAEAKIAVDSEDALPFIYEKLGGLIRTPAEQAQAEKRKKEAMAKGKKKMIE